MTGEEEKLIALRHEMVDKHLRARGIEDPRVLEAFGEVPRERFIRPSRQHEAYADYPLPIGGGQTISQPYIVALMVQELDLAEDHRVLDVGAGSGYQTAILARLSRHVYAVERIEALSQTAAATLAELNVDNVTIRTADGSLGWAEEAPFDRIICGAAAPELPGAWIDQLTDGGRIVLPVGGEDVQVLLVVEKHGRKIRRREVCGVRFVKLIGRDAWPEI